MSKLTEWLAAFDHTSDVSEISVTIKGTTYVGARYTQNDSVRLYLLGALPACYRRSTRTAFVIDGEDWYIACYMEGGKIAADNAQYHPHGEHFMLCKWSVPSGDAIDRYEPTPYTRVPTTIRE